MKLRNKKTGEICNKIIGYITNTILVISTKNGDTICGNTVVASYDNEEDLYQEWEDYEEPKEYYFIAGRGDVEHSLDRGDIYDIKHKDMGNYFETKEEAEKAAEKLKAWKRLKDKGFRFNGRYKPNYGEKFVVECRLPKETLVVDVTKDLDLLFGGEE